MTNLSNFSENNLAGRTENELKRSLVTILSGYGKPSFGSMSKRDADLMMFDVLQKLKFISEDPTAYEVMQKLQVTKSKARNLIYESALRKAQEYNVDEKLVEALGKPIFLTGADKMIGLELKNPLLIDHLKEKLRDLGHITDGSFNQDLVKMTPNAMSALYVEYVPENTRAALMGELVAAGVEEDPNAPLLKGMKTFFTKLVSKVAMDGTDALLSKIGDTLPRILAGAASHALIAAII